MNVIAYSKISRAALKAVFFSCFLVPALFWLSGCQTAPPRGAGSFPEPGADWTTLVGQLRYVTPERAVIGEAVVSRLGQEHFQLDFLAGPGVPLMRLREWGMRAEAEGLFARGYWSGSATRAGRLASWTALREVFSSVEQVGKAPVYRSVDQSPISWRAEVEWNGRRLQRVAVEFPSTKERFIFVFSH